METIFMNTENSKMSESHKFVLNFPRRLNLRSCSSKLVDLLHVEKYKKTV